MSISPEYQPLYNQVRDLRFQIHDAIDTSAGQGLLSEMQHLEDEIEEHKNPRDLENRISGIQRTLQSVRGHEGDFMDFASADHFNRIFEQIRMSLRHLPNY
ncbi:MAG TPA: hypothetical protein VLF62_03110 [Candidatus Saccharimonadales bacterium]|nr:hypothetical protein [Candidatus Saccharimonadales bacterium]